MPEPQAMSVTSLEDAIAWLFQKTSVEDWLFSADAELPQAVQLVCDMYWIRPADLVRKMQRQYNSALSLPTVRSWRSRRSHMGAR